MEHWRSTTGLGLVAVVGAVLLVASAGFPAAQPPDEPVTGFSVMPKPKAVPQRQWEYKQTIPCLAARGRSGGGPPFFEEDLNQQGRQGWELVSLIPAPGAQANRDCFLATFKRETVH